MQMNPSVCTVNCMRKLCAEKLTQLNAYEVRRVPCWIRSNLP